MSGHTPKSPTQFVQQPEPDSAKNTISDDNDSHLSHDTHDELMSIEEEKDPFETSSLEGKRQKKSCKASKGKKDKAIVKRKVYKQRFVDKWLTKKEFSSWLEKRKNKSNDFQPYCISCNQFLTCGKLELIVHSSTTKHKQNMLTRISFEPQRKAMTDFVNNKTKYKSLIVELRLCCLVAEENLAISITDKIVPLVKSISKDPVMNKSLLEEQKLQI